MKCVPDSAKEEMEDVIVFSNSGRIKHAEIIRIMQQHFGENCLSGSNKT